MIERYNSILKFRENVNIRIFLIYLVYERARKYLPSMLTEKQIDDQKEFERKYINDELVRLRSLLKLF